MNMHFLKWPALVGFAAVSAIAFAQDAPRSMPPMAVKPSLDAAKAAEVLAMWLPQTMAASMQISARVSALPKSSKAVNSDHSKRLVIGSSRELAPAQQRIALDQLAWHTLADGSKAARARIDIEAATSVRLGYRLEGAVSESGLRFMGTDASQVEAGAASLQNEPTLWTSILDGNALFIDVRLASGASPAGSAIVIEHAVGLDVKADLSKRESDIGRAPACHIDLACVANRSQALRDAEKSVAKIVFQSGLSTVLCSATLIANASQRPLLYTASHCIATQAEASSLVSYWAFQAADCGSRVIPTFQRITGGANVRFNDARIDVTLMEMGFSPPNNAIFAGWTQALGRRASAITGLHHPIGDLMKYSSGETVGYTNVENITAEGRLPGDQTSSYWTVRWSQGSTEEGSSGSGLYTFDNSSICPGGCYLFRGSLSQGSAACDNPTGTDRYARFDLAYPYIASVIDPAGVPTPMNGSIATEYYNVTNDHYFITADPSEAASLDVPSTRITGWFRTGQQFGVYPSGTLGTAPVCRFFGDLPIGGPNSHFYTADRGECNVVASPNSGWKLEGGDAFRVVLPIGNSCPSGTRALYRTYNYHNTPTYRNTLTGRNGYDSNHRYFTDAGYFDIMLEKDAWNLEPSGRVPLMCVR